MSRERVRPSVASVIYFTFAFLAGAYFVTAAVQGEYGLFRQIEIDAKANALMGDRERLEAEVAALRNLTRRLSDGFLDLDLLDERVRDVLGYVRPDEVVLR